MVSSLYRLAVESQLTLVATLVLHLLAFAVPRLVSLLRPASRLDTRLNSLLRPEIMDLTDVQVADRAFDRAEADEEAAAEEPAAEAL
jgi:hypothetical protein